LVRSPLRLLRRDSSNQSKILIWQIISLYDYGEFNEYSARWVVDFGEKLMLRRWQPAGRCGGCGIQEKT
jgi:hypothetical protein